MRPFPHSQLVTATLLLFVATTAGAAPQPEAGAEPPSPVVPVLRPPSGEPMGFSFPEPTPVSDVYRAWGNACGVQVFFDPKFRDSKTAFELTAVTPLRALAILTRSAGHFAVALDETTVLIADDTPQNRRTHERQVIRTFQLENLRLADAMTMVRSLLGLKNVSANEGLNTITARDTAAKIEVAGLLLATADKPRAEVTVDVELLYLGAGERERLARPRLAAAELERLRRAARRLTRQGLAVLDNDRGRWVFKDELTVTAAPDTVSYLEVGFELTVEPRVHSRDEVTLEVELALADAAVEDADDEHVGPVAARRRLESGIRLASGESFLLAVAQVAPQRTGSWLASRFDLPREPGEIVLALTPRIVRGPGFTQSDLEAICVGTETFIELCGRGELPRTSDAASHEDAMRRGLQGATCHVMLPSTWRPSCDS